MMIKKLLYGILIVVIIAYMSFYIAFYVMEMRAQKERFKEWYTDQYLPSSYKGIVCVITDDGNPSNRCDSVLRILTPDKKLVSYNISFCKDTSFSNFIKVGDTVIKEANDSSVLIIHDNGRKIFTLPFYRNGDK